MLVGILLSDSARDVNVEIQSSRHREIFEISSRVVQKLAIGSHLKVVHCSIAYFDVKAFPVLLFI